MRLSVSIEGLLTTVNFVNCVNDGFEKKIRATEIYTKTTEIKVSFDVVSVIVLRTLIYVPDVQMKGFFPRN